jgi:endogenous inhibitor of DNA gyrase (YacG/DUF329 family)/uncharacterized protein YhhL (DUF1145 family)
MPKKAPPVVEEEEEVTCPVCGKPVGLEVTTCPYCGAEFESEDEEAPEEEPVEAEEAAAPQAKEAPAEDEEDTAECPVCGKNVSLAVASCPYCGAEFEEEEVEEVIEVEEKAPEQVEAAEVEPEPARKAVVAEEEVEEGGLEFSKAEIPTARPTPLIDLKVIGISLIILGIIGSQISVFIDWYWNWVPPIEDNMVMFIAIPLVLIVVGLAVFMLVRSRKAAGKKVAKSMPSATMSVLIFGVFAMIMIALWKPINDALQSNSVTVAGAFFAVLVIGILVVFMGTRMTARAAA